ncbi:MAG TPA: LysR substrate-binding domain-containing protein, partial [Micromonospora sp.]
GNRAIVDRAFASAGVRRRVTIEITDIGTGTDFIRNGLGIALLPRFVIGAHRGLTALTVTGADLDWPLSLATAAEREPGAAARALIRLLGDFLPAPTTDR